MNCFRSKMQQCLSFSFVWTRWTELQVWKHPYFPQADMCTLVLRFFHFLCWPQGGVIGILIKWDCNLDRLMQRCLPRYSFKRLDEKESNKTLYPGLNFRWVRVKGHHVHTVFAYSWSPHCQDQCRNFGYFPKANNLCWCSMTFFLFQLS